LCLLTAVVQKADMELLVTVVLVVLLVLVAPGYPTLRATAG
jgi:hypothetical protein